MYKNYISYGLEIQVDENMLKYDEIFEILMSEKSNIHIILIDVTVCFIILYMRI